MGSSHLQNPVESQYGILNTAQHSSMAYPRAHGVPGRGVGFGLSPFGSVSVVIAATPLPTASDKESDRRTSALRSPCDLNLLLLLTLDDGCVSPIREFS